jgi:hypothetical protein
MRLLLFLLALLPGSASDDGETLRYSINWPSGLSLGEATLTSKQSDKGVQASFRLDASVPGFAVADEFSSSATAEFCSLEFNKDLTHGKRKSQEKVVFDQANRTATRETINGGKSQLNLPSCAKDPLAFLMFARDELKSGRVPAAQPVFYGAGYDVRLEYAGTQSIRFGDRMVETDRLSGTVKGPASEAKFEALFMRDAARTPLIIRVPLPLGSFSMELMP